MGVRYTKVTTDDLAMLAAAVVAKGDAATAAHERSQATNDAYLRAVNELTDARRKLREAVAVFTGLVDDRGDDDDAAG